MKQYHAVAVSPVSTWGVRLIEIWHVQADRTYDVNARGREHGRLIAIRTISGEGEIRFVDHRIIRLKANSLAIFDDGHLEGYRCIASSWEFHWFRFTVQHAEHIPQYKRMNIALLPGETMELESCFQYLRKNHPNAALIAASQFESLLSRLLYANTIRHQVAGPQQALAESLIDYMHQNLGSVTVAKLAQKACLSERRLRIVFKAVTGKSPKEFYDILRLNEGASMLRNSAQTLFQIADTLGYSSEFHFSKAFRKNFGIPPSQYRRKQ
jgi:AraC-like DNA-binding protein